jgi:Pyruvate/2-oxoacid:ferredoxin oxidoreductase gamma subunit
MVMLGCLLGSGLLPATVDAFGKTMAERVAAASRKSNNEALGKGAELAGRVPVGGEAR